MKMVSTLLPVALALAVLASPQGACAAPPQQAQVSQALDFSIVIPEVLRILENRHPSSITRVETTSGHLLAVQRMVIVSTLGKGFCVDLQMPAGLFASWQVEVSGSAGTYLERAELGYRLCTRRPGRYDLALRHDFELAAAGRALEPAAALGWPVQISLATP
jgi:hypothetical protein